MKSPRKTTALAVLAVVGLVAGAATWYSARGNPLTVQLLDVSGYDDVRNSWIPFRVTVGITNSGRDLVRIRRIHVEPDFDDFNEAYNVGTYELNPALTIEPGASASYQAATTLLNATQLAWRTHALVLRVRVEQNGADAVYEFPAEFDHAERPDRRAIRY